jgi:hypothetical protein
LLAAFTGVPATVVAATRRASYGTSLVPELLQPVIEACAKYKLVQAPFDARDIIDPAVLRLS